jgi:hypothetical protein
VAFFPSDWHLQIPRNDENAFSIDSDYLGAIEYTYGIFPDTIAPEAPTGPKRVE